MKVILINGSRREKGCTRTALEEIARELEACGVESELIFIGNRAVNGKINEAVKEVGEKMREAASSSGLRCTMLPPPGK